jgi:Na+/phosphate symporter
MSIDDPERARRRAEITRLLSRYPHLEEEALHDLANWFASEASSLDVALLSQEEAVKSQYRAYREAHIDRLRLGDWAKGLAVATVVLGLLAAVLWRAF